MFDNEFYYHTGARREFGEGFGTLVVKHYDGVAGVTTHRFRNVRIDTLAHQRGLIVFEEGASGQKFLAVPALAELSFEY